MKSVYCSMDALSPVASLAAPASMKGTWWNHADVNVMCTVISYAMAFAFTLPGSMVEGKPRRCTGRKGASWTSRVGVGFGCELRPKRFDDDYSLDEAERVVVIDSKMTIAA